MTDKTGFATGGIVRHGRAVGLTGEPLLNGEILYDSKTGDVVAARLSQPQAWHPPGEAGKVTRRYTAMLDEINGTKTVDMTEDE